MSYKAKAGAVLALVAFLLIIAPVANADPIVITTSTNGFALPGLGNNGNGVTNPDFDSLFGFAHSASHDANSMGTRFVAVLNPLLFKPGFTGFGSAGTRQFNFFQELTINGQTQVLNLFGQLTITAVVDTIVVSGGDPLIFQFDTFPVAVRVLPVTHIRN